MKKAVKVWIDYYLSVFNIFLPIQMSYIYTHTREINSVRIKILPGFAKDYDWHDVSEAILSVMKCLWFGYIFIPSHVTVQLKKKKKLMVMKLSAKSRGGGGGGGGLPMIIETLIKRVGMFHSHKPTYDYRQNVLSFGVGSGSKRDRSMTIWDTEASGGTRYSFIFVRETLRPVGLAHCLSLIKAFVTRHEALYNRELFTKRWLL